MAHFLVLRFYQQAYPALSCTSKPPLVLSEPCSPFFWHFSLHGSSFSLLQPPTVAPFLGQDLCVPWEGLFFISSHFSPLFGSRHTRFFFHSFDPTSLWGSFRSKCDSNSGEVHMATKNPIFTSIISGSPTITSKKLIGSENYLS